MDETDQEVHVRVGQTTISFAKNDVQGSVDIAGRRRRFPDTIFPDKIVVP